MMIVVNRKACYVVLWKHLRIFINLVSIEKKEPYLNRKQKIRSITESLQLSCNTDLQTLNIMYYEIS